MRRHHQRTDHVVGQMRLLPARGGGIEELGVDAARSGKIGGMLQPAQLGRVERDIDGAGALIVKPGAAVAADSADELVVQLEAARHQRQQRTCLMRFKIRREDAGRRLSGTETCWSFVDKLDRGPAARQLVGHRTADHAGADHNDVAAHHAILPIR